MFRRVPSPLSAKSPFRRGLGVVLLLLLGLAGADLHSSADLHGTASALGGGSYFPEASHPEAPLHVETAHEERLRPCATCLAQLQGSGAPPPGAAGTALGPPRRAPLHGDRFALHGGRPTLRRGRAPPLS
jgi:hypothetical protein